MAIAALTRPHICTFYDVGHQDGSNFLVVEYVDGETLAARMARAEYGKRNLRPTHGADSRRGPLTVHAPGLKTPLFS